MLSLILPVFNEEINIPPFYEILSARLKSLPSYSWEILFVDDGSTDQSFSEIMKLREKDDRIKVLRLSRNFGAHPALAAGLAHASGEAAILMSVDLQDPPEIIAGFLAEWEKGAEVVWGLRRSRRDPWLRKFFTWIFYRFFIKRALPQYPEGGIDCSLLDRRVIDAVNKIEIRGTSIFAVIVSLNFNQAFVPYDRAARAGGVSKFSFIRLMKLAADILRTFSGGKYKPRPVRGAQPVYEVLETV